MTSCPACQREVPPGDRWCRICHSNLTSPTVGRLASPGKRLGAYFIDFVLPIGAAIFIMTVGGAGALAGGERAGGGLGCLLMSGLLLAYVVFAVRLFAQGTTPGKRALGMRVVKEDGTTAGFGTMLFREWIGKVISRLVFLLGYLWILLDKDRQAWHDKLASTYVVENRA